jgi:hypothetical protein
MVMKKVMPKCYIFEACNHLKTRTTSQKASLTVNGSRTGQKSLVEHNSVLLLHLYLPKADRLIHKYKAAKYANPRDLRQTGIQW